jgi:hypothetical protein
MLFEYKVKFLKDFGEFGARGGTRTPILFTGLAPKASASTNSATLAYFFEGF